MIDKNFSQAVSKNITFDSIDEITGVSEEIINFCKENGIEGRRSFFCGLCMEEMAINTYAEKKRKSKLCIFIVIENNEITIYFQDDAECFDPKAALGTNETEDPCRNIGIKIMSKIASSMDYQVSLGTNLLIENYNIEVLLIENSSPVQLPL